MKSNISRYKKGVLDDKLKSLLVEKKSKAIERAKAFPEFCNPSTKVYLLVEELDAIKNQEHQ